MSEARLGKVVTMHSEVYRLNCVPVLYAVDLKTVSGKSLRLGTVAYNEVRNIWYVPSHNIGPCGNVMAAAQELANYETGGIEVRAIPPREAL